MNYLSYVQLRLFENCNARPPGGFSGATGIKVGNMMDSCCGANPSGSIADTLFLKRLSLPRFGSSAAVRNHAR